MASIPSRRPRGGQTTDSDREKWGLPDGTLFVAPRPSPALLSKNPHPPLPFWPCLAFVCTLPLSPQKALCQLAFWTSSAYMPADIGEGFI